MRVFVDGEAIARDVLVDDVVVHEHVPVHLQALVSTVAFYKGYAQNVLVRANDGRKIQFPAEILKPYLTREGINGHFIIHFDDRNKYQSLQKIG